MTVLEFLSGLLTPAIAVVMTYIAIQQYRTRQSRLRLDLFDRRYAIYQGVKEFIRHAVSAGDVQNQAIADLNESTHDAFFLFDESVDEYVDELRQKGARLHYLQRRLGDGTLPIGEERSAFAQEDADIMTWFGFQLGESKKVFKKFLRV